MLDYIRSFYVRDLFYLVVLYVVMVLFRKLVGGTANFNFLWDILREFRYRLFVTANIPRDLVTGPSVLDGEILDAWKDEIPLSGTQSSPAVNRFWIRVGGYHLRVSKDIYLKFGKGRTVRIRLWLHTRIVLQVEGLK